MPLPSSPQSSAYHRQQTSFESPRGVGIHHNNSNNHSRSGDHDDGHAQRLEFFVPSERVGAIMGPAGRRAHDLQRSFNVEILVEREAAGTGVRKISISGRDSRAVHDARERVFEIAK